MTLGEREQEELEILEARLIMLLPEEYQDSYDEVEPKPMRSAGLKFASDGRVAWNEIWGSFCDLAMAGGPPHKGTLLEPATRAQLDARSGPYGLVVEEICRGITLVTGLDAQLSPTAGWIRVTCLTGTMAGWLVRAISMENIAARADGKALDLPAAPGYRLDKEIKNVITVIAKTCHYWLGHMPRRQQRAIARVFAEMAAESPLVEPAQSRDGGRDPRHQAVFTRIAARIARDTGLRESPHRYAGWLGIECPSVRAAIWMMRMLVVCNVLSRREETVLFLPVNPALDPDGDIVVRALLRVHRFALARGIL